MAYSTPVKEAQTKGPSGTRLLRAVKSLEQTQAVSLEEAEAAREAAAKQRLAQLALQAAEQGLHSYETHEFEASDFNPFTEAQVTEAREAIWRAWGQCLRIDPNHYHIDK